MISINIPSKYNTFIQEYSKKLTLNGFSNLNSNDLSKASRGDFQKTGLFGEIAFKIYKSGDATDLKNLIDKKLEHYNKTGKGDDGFDDSITYKGITRLVDVKTSHTDNENRINTLNLVIPEREKHSNMIYVCAFTIGKTRIDIDKVVLAGWCYTHDIKKRWTIDVNKWAVPVKELRPMSELEKYIR